MNANKKEAKLALDRIKNSLQEIFYSKTKKIPYKVVVKSEFFNPTFKLFSGKMLVRFIKELQNLGYSVEQSTIDYSLRVGLFSVFFRVLEIEKYFEDKGLVDFVNKQKVNLYKNEYFFIEENEFKSKYDLLLLLQYLEILGAEINFNSNTSKIEINL